MKKNIFNLSLTNLAFLLPVILCLFNSPVFSQKCEITVAVDNGEGKPIANEEVTLWSVPPCSCIKRCQNCESECKENRIPAAKNNPNPAKTGKNGRVKFDVECGKTYWVSIRSACYFTQFPCQNDNHCLLAHLTANNALQTGRSIQDSTTPNKFNNPKHVLMNLSINGLQKFGNNIVGSQMQNKTLFQSAPLVLFPSPAQTQIFIMTNSYQGSGELVLLNLLGKEIMKKNIEINVNDKYSFDISILNSGVYIVMLRDGHTILSGKFIKR